MELPAFLNKVWSNRGFEPASDLLDLERAANVVTLYMITIHFSEQIENRQRFDAFGNHFQIKGMRKLDGCLDDQLIIRIANDIAHERLVDLELFDG
jgi:hypothetical protein